MSVGPMPGQLRLPESLQAQLHEFRRRVWSIKLLEAACATAFGVLAAFLAVYALDRVMDTPAWARAILFAGVALSNTLIPLALYRWVYRNRRLEQLARLLTRKHPLIGDQLLGVIELAHSDSEQKRSRRLVEAAIAQVAEDAKRRDFLDAVPTPRHVEWIALAGLAFLATAALFVNSREASANALARLLAPWRDIPRYTFAALAPIPAEIVVAHGEPFTFEARLAANSAAKPEQAVATLGARPEIWTKVHVGEGLYRFDLPALIEPTTLDLRVGDARRRIRVKPMLRPELNAVVAQVTLPEYLGRPGATEKDVRGGSITLVKGAHAAFSATAGRDLSSATIDGRPASVSGAKIVGPTVNVEGASQVEFRWKDAFGLEGKEPFAVTVTGREDEAPSLACEDLPRQKVVLDSEVLAFKVHAQDDFGVRRVGMAWQGAESPANPSPARGEQWLGAGGPDKENLDLGGTFSAKALGIEPQPIELRVFVEDYLPGRERVYSAPYIFYVLSPEQHAIWLTEQLSKWHRQSLEVRDREMLLHEQNKQIRALSQEELDRPETRKRIEEQAAAERSNGRRLSALTAGGEDLVRQAMRNPEFGVGHLEKWGEMLQILKDISGNRMPSVAGLLKQAATAPVAALAVPKPSAPTAGQDRSTSPPKPSDMDPNAKPKPSAPSVADRESQHQDYDKDAEDKPGAKKKPSAGALRLATTTLGGKSAKGQPDPPPAEETVEEAVTQQRDLLAEFEKVSEELNKVLANLEGSTLVKRLKAASREQTKIAGRITDQVGDTFGAATVPASGAPGQVLADLAKEEAKGSQAVSVIMDDMQAYYERRQYLQFKAVLDDMKKQDVIGGLRQVGDDLRKEHGVSIAQCEYWSDTLDRWAEDLVDPTASGKCPGGKSRSSLPPSIVLEVLQVLEGEVNLREQTRVAEQARPAQLEEQHEHAARKLAADQGALKVRIEKVIDRILELPDAEAEFAKEIELLDKVVPVMGEARGILDSPDTGAPAIAAETEAIELLLQSKRINPKGGGGGGSTPGGGGQGTTTDSALALLGKGLNDKEVREDRGVSQATGDSGPALPEEFRAGLDEYFNRVDRKPDAR